MDLSELVHNHRSAAGGKTCSVADGHGSDGGGGGVVSSQAVVAATTAGTRPPIIPRAQHATRLPAWENTTSSPDPTAVHADGNEAPHAPWPVPVSGDGHIGIGGRRRQPQLVAQFGKRLRDCDHLNTGTTDDDDEHMRSLDAVQGTTGWPPFSRDDLVGSVDTLTRRRPAFSATITAVAGSSATAASVGAAASSVVEDGGTVPVAMRDVGAPSRAPLAHAGRNTSLREQGLVGLRSDSVQDPWAMQVEAPPRSSNLSSLPGPAYALCHSPQDDRQTSGLLDNLRPIQVSPHPPVYGGVVIAAEHRRTGSTSNSTHQDSDPAARDNRLRYDAPTLQRHHQENAHRGIESGNPESASNASVPHAVILTCDICERTFDQQSMFDSHMAVFHRRSATPTKPRSASFSCQYCGKGFTSPSKVNVHVEATHLGMRPFQCDLCNKCFGYKGDLTKHKATHSGLKEHTCYICGAKFGRNFYVKRHILTVHEKQDPPAQ